VKPSILVPIALCLLAAACAQHYIKGSVNDVTYHMSLDRGPVPGAQEADMGIQIVMDRLQGLEGTLVVDGIPYGSVAAGDHVEVTDDAAVLVNGQVRPSVDG